MYTTDKKKSQEELNYLYTLSVIPAVIIFAIAVAYYGFIHLEQIHRPDSLMWDLLVNLFPLILIPIPAAFFFTFEILYSRKIENSGFHAKRFLGRMVTVFITGLLFVTIYLASFFFLAPLITERFAMLSSLWIWLLMLAVMIGKSKRFLQRLGEGEW